MSKQYMATFAGNEAVMRAIDEALGYTGDAIDALGLKKPDGSVPEDDWAPAAFKAESGMHIYDIRCTGNGYLDGVDEDIAERYNAPENETTASWMLLEGPESDIKGFCQAVCDMAGMRCNIAAENESGEFGVIASVAPAKNPVPDPESMIIDVDELDYDMDELDY